ncbi:hypothetical protein L1987_89028 [Smallanthus sonchifolius]|nr:hypothetical protein L1987_89028 [Smallanthus sonchifolius]
MPRMLGMKLIPYAVKKASEAGGYSIRSNRIRCCTISGHEPDEFTNSFQQTRDCLIPPPDRSYKGDARAPAYLIGLKLLQSDICLTPHDPSTRGINKQPGDGRTTSVPIPEAFSDRSRSNANIRFQRNRFLGNLGHCVFEDFDAFLFRSMNRYCEGAANQSHFSEKSIGLEISSCSFIPSFKESEMAWQQA